MIAIFILPAWFVTAQNKEEVWHSIGLEEKGYAYVRGRIGIFDALEGSIQIFSTLNGGIGFRSAGEKNVQFYGGAGLHVYASYCMPLRLWLHPFYQIPLKPK